MAQLRAHFEAGAGAVVVSGLAGIGKSAFAAHAAGPEGIWVSLAENAAGGAATSARSMMAAILEHAGHDPGGDVVTAFAAAAGELPTTMVLDDVRDPSEVRRVVAAAPAARFIITSRSRFPAAPRHEASLELGGLAHRAAAEFLADRGVPLDSATAKQEVTEALDMLAGHPLSLILFAGAVAQRPTWSMADHVARLSGVGGDELSDALTSVRASLAEVGDAGPALRLLSHVPRGRLDIELAAAFLGEDARFLGQLSDAGLIMIEGDSVRVHDVVAQVARRDSAREDRAGWIADKLRDLNAAVLDRLIAAVGASYPGLKQTLIWLPPASIEMSVADASAWLERNLPMVLAVAEVARSTGDHQTLLRIGQLIGFWGPDTAHSVTVLTLCRTARHVAELHGSVIDRYYAERFLGRALERLGRWAEARRAHQASVDHAVAAGDRTLEARARYGVASTTELLGDTTAAIKELELICTIFETGDPHDLAQTLAGMVVILWRVGEVSRSIECGNRALSLMNQSDPVVFGMTHSNLVEPYLLNGDLEAAREHASIARQVVAPLGSPLLDSFIDLQFALLAGIDGDAAAAEAGFDLVSARAAELDAPFLLAQSENYRGMTLLRQGDRDGARAAFTRALEAGDAYSGDHLLAAEGLAATASRSVKWRGHLIWAAPPSPRVNTAWGLLTEREREVAELVADGLKDAEIARSLVLSPRTVESHVASIRRKLQVATRAGISRALAD